MKICKACKVEKELDEFYKKTGSRDKLDYVCKKCALIRTKENKKKNPEKVKERSRKWRLNNPEKVKEQYRRASLKNHSKKLESTRSWRKNNKNKIREYSRKWDIKNTERRKELSINYREKNKEKIKELRKKWYFAHKKEEIMRAAKWSKEHPEARRRCARNIMARYLKTPKGMLSSMVRKRLNESLREKKNGRHWQDLVGFTVEELKLHIEKQFKLGMNWGNYGQWEVDHKIPQAVFNFENPEDIDFKKCWSLKNLQPLWKKENRIKGASLIKPFQPSLAIKI
jgi:hypothetical protein